LFLIQAMDVPCGPSNTVADASKDPHAKARGLLRHVPHPSGVEVPRVCNPIRFAGSAMEQRGPPPLLGHLYRQASTIVTSPLQVGPTSGGQFIAGPVQPAACAPGRAGLIVP
jgi:crotonobetainyl-CoA:carnitine CoA-transferase CaiB-like acyl-CoA transferase